MSSTPNVPKKFSPTWELLRWITRLASFQWDNVQWDNVPEQVKVTLAFERDRGQLAARFDCREKTTGRQTHQRQLITEVFIANKDVYNRCLGATLQISNDTIKTTHTELNLHVFTHQLATQQEDTITLVVGAKTLTRECFNSKRVIILTCSNDEIQQATKRLRQFASICEKALCWTELGDDLGNNMVNLGLIKLSSQGSIGAFQLYNDLEGTGLNRVLKTQENINRSSIPRWYVTTRFVGEEDKTTYLVVNVKKANLHKISNMFKEEAKYVGDLDDLSYQLFRRKVLVTDEIDPDDVLDYISNMYPGTIKILKFENDELFSVSPKIVLEARLTIITGGPGDGKSAVLNHLFGKCTEPALIASSEEIMEAFPEEKKHSKEESFVAKLPVSSGEELFIDNKHVIFIDDNKHFAGEKRFQDIIENWLSKENIQAVLATRDEYIPERESPLRKNCAVVKLFKLTRREIIAAIKNALGSSFRTLDWLPERIFDNHYLELDGMPLFAWVAAANVYQKDSRSAQILRNIRLKIHVSEIYEAFIQIWFEISIQDSRFSGTLPHFKRAHVLDKMNKLSPEFMQTAKIAWDEFDTTNLLQIKNANFDEYLCDLFCLEVLNGNITSSNPIFSTIFSKFFVERYVQLHKHNFHLNNMLGYTDMTNQITFDINQIDLERVLRLSGRYPNIVRILFKSCLEPSNKNKFMKWYNSAKLLDVNIADLMGSMEFISEKNVSIPDAVTWCSAYFGFVDLLKFSMETASSSLCTQHIDIRYRESFPSLLHLLMFQSRDNDPITVTEKKEIVKYLVGKKKYSVNCRDYFGNTPLLEQNVSFELVQYMKSKGASLEATDYKRNNLLDKNIENEEFTFLLRENFPTEFRKLNTSFYLRKNDSLEHSIRLLSVEKDTQWNEERLRVDCDVNDFTANDVDITQVAYLFEALDKGLMRSSLETICKKLTKAKYAVPAGVVREALATGSFNLFEKYTKQLKFTLDRWNELNDDNGAGIVHHVVANSIHNSAEVIIEKIKIIDLIKANSREAFGILDKERRTPLLADQVHYKLVKHLIENGLGDVTAQDANGYNVLNVCLQNIILLSKYLGENAYDFDYSHHHQAIFLAKKLRQANLTLKRINQPANDQIKEIMEGAQQWVNVKSKELHDAGFRFNVEEIAKTSVSSPERIPSEESGIDCGETNEAATSSQGSGSSDPTVLIKFRRSPRKKKQKDLETHVDSFGLIKDTIATKHELHKRRLSPIKGGLAKKVKPSQRVMTRSTYDQMPQSRRSLVFL